jgi:hypothetical protein
MNGQSQPYQLLTSENAALVLVDHQVGLMTGVRDYSTGELKHNVVALAKASESYRHHRPRQNVGGGPSLSWWSCPTWRSYHRPIDG